MKAALAPDGGGDRDRTDDPLLAKQVLSQLSYTPGCRADQQRQAITGAPKAVPLPIPGSLTVLHAPVVGQGGFEPPTSRLSSARSNQLSY